MKAHFGKINFNTDIIEDHLEPELQPDIGKIRVTWKQKIFINFVRAESYGFQVSTAEIDPPNILLRWELTVT